MRACRYLDFTAKTEIQFACLFSSDALKLARRDSNSASRDSNVKTVGGGVLDCRIDFGPGYRIYFGRHGTNLSCCLLAEPRTGSNGASRQRMRDGLIIKNDVHIGNDKMPLTKDFKETVRARAGRDPDFRAALLIEATEQLLAGDLETGKAVLRDYINATVGFEKLARETGTPSKSLMRMLGPKGNPRASNLLAVLGNLQRISGIHLAVARGRSRLLLRRASRRAAA